jgi:hypothetical protein
MAAKQSEADSTVPRTAFFIDLFMLPPLSDYIFFLITCMFQTHFGYLYQPPFVFAPLRHRQGQLQNFPAEYAV